jgi:hypothetical protein
MSDWNNLPARVTRMVAMRLLSCGTDRTFAKVVDANPQLKHRLPGEVRFKYLTGEIRKLLAPPTVCDPRGRKQLDHL